MVCAKWTLLAIGSLSVLVGGCASTEVQRSVLASRYDAASRISDPDTKDTALEAVARDAALRQAGDVTYRAVMDMVSVEARDRAASELARKLVLYGDYGYANALARLIKDSTIRDETFASLAEPSPKTETVVQIQGRP